MPGSGKEFVRNRVDYNQIADPLAIIDGQKLRDAPSDIMADYGPALPLDLGENPRNQPRLCRYAEVSVDRLVGCPVAQHVDCDDLATGGDEPGSYIPPKIGIGRNAVDQHHRGTGTCPAIMHANGAAHTIASKGCRHRESLL